MFSLKDQFQQGQWVNAQVMGQQADQRDHHQTEQPPLAEFSLSQPKLQPSDPIPILESVWWLDGGQDNSF
jgi:hypothetical protein